MLKHATVHAGLGIAMHHDSSGGAAGTIISLSLGNMCHTSIGHGVFVLQQASNPPPKKKRTGEKNGLCRYTNMAILDISWTMSFVWDSMLFHLRLVNHLLVASGFLAFTQ